MLRGIVVTTWMLVFALGLAKSASAAPPNFSQEDSYTVLIYGDPRVFNRYHLGREIKHLEETFKRPVLAYAINSMQDFGPSSPIWQSGKFRFTPLSPSAYTTVRTTGGPTSKFAMP